MSNQAMIDQINSDSETVNIPAITALLSSTWGSSEIAVVADAIQQATHTDMTPEDLDKVMEESKESTEADTTNTYSSKVDYEVKELEDSKRDGYIVQDAVKELIQKEPVSKNGQNAPTLPDSTFSITKDNSESYNFVDNVKNWFKINKKTKQVEALLANGSLIKLDGEGNCTIYTKGSVKQIIDGSYVLEVGGQYEVYVGGKLITKVASDVTETYGGSHNTNVSGIRKEKASQIHHN